VALLIPLLNLLILSVLAVLAVLVVRRRPGSLLHRYFALTSLALIAWLGSLYALLYLPPGPSLTLIGRVNFGAVLVAVTLSFLFVSELAGRQPGGNRHRIVWVETAALIALTVATPLVDRREAVVAGVHVTEIGPLFALFALHVAAYPALAGTCAFQARNDVRERVRSQLTLVAAGILVTAVINIITGVVLPYGYGIFAYEEPGALAVAAFAGAVGYAILTARLFDLRLVIRRTVLYAALFGIIEKVYSALVEGAAHAIPGTTPAEQHLLSVVLVAMIAVAYHPFRTWLEGWLDRLLFGKHHRDRLERGTHRSIVS